MLFVHNDTLIRHTATAHPPVTADAATQRIAIREFLSNHDQEFSEVVLDEAWLDEVLTEFTPQLGNAVVVCRPTNVAGLSSVSVDFATSALIAVGHLYARGFEEIWLAVPYPGFVAIESMDAAVAAAANKFGTPIATANIRSAATPEDREQIIAALKTTDKRIGIFCAEDNVSLLLWQRVVAEGIPCPAKVGILSGMGTRIVTDQHVSSLRIDYVHIGRTAAEILLAGERRNVSFPADLTLGVTT